MTQFGAAILAITIAQAMPAIRSYDDLMSAPSAQRDQLFAASPPDIRAAIKRQHMETWLTVHQPDLSRRQVAAVREAIAMVTPAMYSTEPDVKTRAAVDAMSHRLYCAVGADLAPTLAQISAPPKRLHRTWRQSAANWIDWAVNCVA